jgi:cytochrome c-type biogenesis protein CcmH
MKLLVGILLLLAAAVAQGIDPLPFRDPAEEERFRQLTAELRCVMCQNQSLADSNAGIAGDLRREVLDLMHAGKSDQEIKSFLVERYTEFVLYDPPMRADTLLLWAGPAVVLLGGLVAVVMIIRRRSAALDDKRPPDEDPGEW